MIPRGFVALIRRHVCLRALDVRGNVPHPTNGSYVVVLYMLVTRDTCAMCLWDDEV